MTRVRRTASAIWNRLAGQSGFTLIELTVVVAVIALLAAAVLPNVTGLSAAGRSTGKLGDLHEVTLAVERFRIETKTLPVVGPGVPVERVRDADGDGVIRIAVDTNAANGTGALPPTIDATCATSSASLAAAFAECLGAVDLALLRDFLKGNPQHAGEDVTDAAYDGGQSTPDLVFERVNLHGDGLAVYVQDDGGPGGTAFPCGALRVWNVDKNGRVLVLKDDTQYGR